MLSEEESSDRFDDTDENEDNKLTWEEYLSDTFGVSANDIQTDDQDNEVSWQSSQRLENPFDWFIFLLIPCIFVAHSRR